MGTVQLRPATPEDREMVFRWRNDSFIVVRGSGQRKVLWDEHCNWFENTIRGDRRKMFIVVKDNQPIGQVRFDLGVPRTCVISTYLLRRFTGQGHGVTAIRQGCRQIFQVWDVETVVACVRYDNPGARAAFLKAGFIEDDRRGLCPEAHFTLTLSGPSRDQDVDEVSPQ